MATYSNIHQRMELKKRPERGFIGGEEIVPPTRPSKVWKECTERGTMSKVILSRWLVSPHVSKCGGAQSFIMFPFFCLQVHVRVRAETKDEMDEKTEKLRRLHAGMQGDGAYDGAEEEEE